MKIEWRRKTLDRPFADSIVGEAYPYLITEDGYSFKINRPDEARQMGKALIDREREIREGKWTENGSWAVMDTINWQSVLSAWTIKKGEYTGQRLFWISHYIRGRRRFGFRIKPEELMEVIKLLVEFVKSDPFKEWDRRWRKIADETDRSAKRILNSQAYKQSISEVKSKHQEIRPNRYHRPVK